jgi:hypothetical protein
MLITKEPTFKEFDCYELIGRKKLEHKKTVSLDHIITVDRFEGEPTLYGITLANGEGFISSTTPWNEGQTISI